MIMAGGTGGHIFPALSVADVLRRKDWKVVWLGSRSGMEATLIPARGYTAALIRFTAVRGKGWLRGVLLPVDLLVAFWQAARAIFLHRPDVVLGMGGYVAFPGGMMASLLNRPLVVHEQNSIAGLANRVLARLADRVLTGFPNAFGPRLAQQWTGTPVREDVAAVAPPGDRLKRRKGRLNLLVIGGSQGARALNVLVPEAVAQLSAEARPEVVHQAGAAHVNSLRERYRTLGLAAEVPAFIDDMGARYAAADLVICRAGASTIAEIAAAGIASVLIPFPHAVDDHQTMNARFLEARGAAVLLREQDASPERLAELIRGFTREKLITMALAAREAGKADATQAVAQVCMELAHAA